MPPKGSTHRDDVIAWLLEKDNPCVRFLTLTQLLGRPAQGGEALEAQAGIPDWNPVRKILSRQRRNGGWDEGTSWYLPKYRSTVWQLIILSQTGIDRSLPAIRRMCEYSFRFQTKSGGFVADKVRERGEWSSLAGCLNGNVVASLCRLGMAGDPRTRNAVEHLMSFQEPDGGWSCRSFGYHKRDRHSCFMGSICALEGLIEYSQRSPEPDAGNAIARACEFLLMHRLFRSDHHGGGVIRKEFTELRAPWLVGYGILRALNAITRAGNTKDERMDEAIDIMLSKRLPSGRWTTESRWPANTYSSFGRLGTEDKWITLQAQLVLRRLMRRSQAPRSLKS